MFKLSLLLLVIFLHGCSYYTANDVNRIMSYYNRNQENVRATQFTQSYDLMVLKEDVRDLKRNLEELKNQ